MAAQHSTRSHLSLEQGLGIAEMASSAQRLIILQDLANGYLAGHGQGPQKQDPAWSDLASEVGQETARLAQLARHNRKGLLGKGAALEANYKSALASAQLDEATKHKIAAGIDAKGGFVAYVTSSLDSLDSDLPAQRESFFALADHMATGAADQARTESLVNTAIKQLIVCGLYGAAAGAAAATGNVVGFIMACAGAVNAGCFG